MANPVGRPSKFTPHTRQKLLEALRAGNYRETACQYAGISHQTLRNWILKAEQPDAPDEYIEFVEAIKKAEADAEVTDIALIRQAAQGGTWQAAAWIRERKNPERWGRREQQQVELSGPDGGPVQLGVGALADVAAIEGLVVALERRQRELAAGVVDAEVVDVEALE